MKVLVTPHSKDNGPIFHDVKYIDPKEQWEEETATPVNRCGQELEFSPIAFCLNVHESKDCREDGKHRYTTCFVSWKTCRKPMQGTYAGYLVITLEWPIH